MFFGYLYHNSGVGQNHDKNKFFLWQNSFVKTVFVLQWYRHFKVLQMIFLKDILSGSGKAQRLVRMGAV